jgi:hypothetical protein
LDEHAVTALEQAAAFEKDVAIAGKAKYELLTYDTDVTVPVTVAVAAPVHTAPEGQQAGLLLLSRAQYWPLAQQMPAKAEPCESQLM